MQLQLHLKLLDELSVGALLRHFRSGRLLCRLLLRLALLLPKFCLEGTRAKATVLVSMQQLRA